MKATSTSIRKYILALFLLAYTIVIHPSKAIGFATGPSFGIAGFHTSFDIKTPRNKTSMGNLALQMGWFATLDLWILYAHLDTLFVLDWYRLPNNSHSNHFKHITVPLTIGTSIFSLLRPHIGLIFRIPIDGFNDIKFKNNKLIERYKEKINGYILGLGIALGHFLMDIDWEFGRSRVTRAAISGTLADGGKDYRPKQLTLRIHYNLLG